MKTSKKIGLFTYLSKGYVPLFDNWINSLITSNIENFKRLELIVLLDENLDKSEIHPTLEHLKSLGLAYRTSKSIFDKELSIERAKAPFQKMQTLQHTYTKIEVLRFLENYPFIIMSDVDMIVYKKWDLDYLICGCNNASMFGFDHNKNGGHQEINTGFCVLKQSSDTGALYDKAMKMAIEKFYYLPDQYILNLIFMDSRNGDMSERYNMRTKLPKCVNHHFYGFADELKKN